MRGYSWKMVNIGFRAAAMTARRFSLQFSLAYALMMLGTGVQLPFLPLWLSAKGVDAPGIGFIIAGMMAVRVVSAPLFAWLADHMQRRRLVIRTCAVLAFITYSSLGLMDGFWPIALTAVLASFFFAPVFPLSEGFSVDASAALGLNYGRMRLWASVSFLAGSLGSGVLLSHLDALSAVWILAGAMGLTVISALVLPDEAVAFQNSEPDPAPAVSAGRLLFLSSFPLFVITAALAQASHGMMNSLGSVHWQSIGFSPAAIGLFWAIAVSTEVLLLVFSHDIVSRFGAGPLFLMGIGGGILRWGLSAFATDLSFIMALQTLHAASFAMTHLGTMYMIRLMVPGHVRNRAQGIYSALSGGLFTAGAMWVSGPLFQHYGSHVYLFMALISAVAFAMAVTLLRVNPTVRAAAAA